MDEPTKDAIIEQQRLIIKDATDTINQLHIELAPHRQWDNFAKREPWRFVLFLLLKDIRPFRWWYGRFER
jgi:hypothetical protein